MTAATRVHPSAVVAPEAELGVGVEVGPYAIVEAGARIGDGSLLHAHAIVRARTTLGARCEVHPFAVIGGSPQDRRHAGEPTSVVIGDDNVFREHVTVHAGTERGGGVTRIGRGGLFMASAHVAHDGVIGDGATLANATLLGGHVVLGDYVVTGGQVAVAPFVRVGSRAFLAGGAMVERDVPPFVIAAGDRARVRALNKVGLERGGVAPASRDALERAFRLLFRGDDARRVAAERLLEDADPLVRELAAFVVAARR
jgi:UDP-N-acetylglucosamine acyltransferase